MTYSGYGRRDECATEGIPDFIFLTPLYVRELCVQRQDRTGRDGYVHFGSGAGDEHYREDRYETGSGLHS